MKQVEDKLTVNIVCGSCRQNEELHVSQRVAMFYSRVQTKQRSDSVRRKVALAHWLLHHHNGGSVAGGRRPVEPHRLQCSSPCTDRSTCTASSADSDIVAEQQAEREKQSERKEDCNVSRRCARTKDLQPSKPGVTTAGSIVSMKLLDRVSHFRRECRMFLMWELQRKNK